MFINVFFPYLFPYHQSFIIIDNVFYMLRMSNALDILLIGIRTMSVFADLNAFTNEEIMLKK